MGPRQGTPARGRLSWSLRERGKFNQRTRLDHDSYMPRTRCSAYSAVHRGAGTGCSRTASLHLRLGHVPGPVQKTVAIGLARGRVLLEGVERFPLIGPHLLAVVPDHDGHVGGRLGI